MMPQCEVGPWICLARREFSCPQGTKGRCWYFIRRMLASTKTGRHVTPRKKTRTRPSSLNKTPWSQTLWYIDEPRWMIERFPHLSKELWSITSQWRESSDGLLHLRSLIKITAPQKSYNRPLVGNLRKPLFFRNLLWKTSRGVTNKTKPHFFDSKKWPWPDLPRGKVKLPSKQTRRSNLGENKKWGRNVLKHVWATMTQTHSMYMQ